MGLFAKKKQENTQNIRDEIVDAALKNSNPSKKELPISLQIIRDIQTSRHISTKLEHAVVPDKISVSRIPSPEFFKDLKILEDEVNFDEKAAEEEAKRAEEEAKKKAEEEAKRLAEEEAKRAEEEAKKKAEEEAKRLAEEEAKRAEEEAQQKAEEEAKRLAEEEAKRAEEEAQQKAEEEAKRLAEEEAKRAEEEAQQKAEEEAKRLAEEEAKRAEEEALKAKMDEVKIVSITAANAKRTKGQTIAKISDVKDGGFAAQKAAESKLRKEEEMRKKALMAEKAAAMKAAQKAAEIERFKDAILIGDAKKPNPDLGKFEIQKSGLLDKPYKLVIKSNVGKVVFETSPIKSKPNELTAIMIKDIMQSGSFSFIKSPQGFAFRILDSRKRLFSVSHYFSNLRDAQLAAAAVKKFGLSANYIDDTTL